MPQTREATILEISDISLGFHGSRDLPAFFFQGYWQIATFRHTIILFVRHSGHEKHRGNAWGRPFSRATGVPGRAKKQTPTETPMEALG